MVDAAEEADIDPDVGYIVTTGFAKAFAAGVDTKKMQHATYAAMNGGNRTPPKTSRFEAVRGVMALAMDEVPRSAVGSGSGCA